MNTSIFNFQFLIEDMASYPKGLLIQKYRFSDEMARRTAIINVLRLDFVPSKAERKKMLSSYLILPTFSTTISNKSIKRQTGHDSKVTFEFINQ